MCTARAQKVARQAPEREVRLNELIDQHDESPMRIGSVAIQSHCVPPMVSEQDAPPAYPFTEKPNAEETTAAILTTIRDVTIAKAHRVPARSRSGSLHTRRVSTSQWR